MFPNPSIRILNEKYSFRNILKLSSVHKYFYPVILCIISTQSNPYFVWKINSVKRYFILWYYIVYVYVLFQLVLPYKWLLRSHSIFSKVKKTFKIVFHVKVIIERTFQPFWKNNEFCFSRTSDLRSHSSFSEKNTKNCFPHTSEYWVSLSERITNTVLSSYKWLLREHFNLSQRWMENYFVKFVNLYFCKFNLISVCLYTVIK